MKEMEIFVDLLDDNEANRILKHFGETPLGTRHKRATLEQKKQHLKKVFKSATPNMIRKRRKGGSDPFYFYIRSYSIPELPTTKDFTQVLSLMKELNEKVPDYVKIAVLISQYPEGLRNVCDEIEQNIANGRNPLDINKTFERIDEVKKFVKEMGSFIGEEAPFNILDRVIKFQPEDYQEQLEKCMNQVKDYNLLQYHNELHELKDIYGLSITNAAYILTHKNEDYDISMLLAIEVMYDLLINQRKRSLNSLEEKLNELTEEAQNDEKERRELIKAKDKEILSLEGELSKLRKFIKKTDNEKEKLDNIITQWKDKYEKLENKIQKDYEDYQISINVLKNEQDALTKELQNELEIKKIIESERIIKYNSDNSHITFPWGLISLSDYELTKEMYPELAIAHADNKKELKTLLKNTEIKTIYLIMKGLSTRQFKKLKQEIVMQNKTYEALEIDSFKELMDWIGYRKTLERNAVTK